eukprot:7006464-Pyramimonas_sp.AAC.1
MLSEASHVHRSRMCSLANLKCLWAHTSQARIGFKRKCYILLNLFLSTHFNAPEKARRLRNTCPQEKQSNKAAALRAGVAALSAAAMLAGVQP